MIQVADGEGWMYQIIRYPMAGTDKVELEPGDILLKTDTVWEDHRPKFIILWILRQTDYPWGDDKDSELS